MGGGVVTSGLEVGELLGLNVGLTVGLTVGSFSTNDLFGTRTDIRTYANHLSIDPILFHS